MQHERLPVDQLVLDPANVRKHPPANIEAIKGSVARFGQQKPVIVDADNVVVAGNGFIEAARELGIEEVDVVRTDLQGVDRTAYAIADNRTAETSVWEHEALRDQLEAINEQDPEAFNATGFDIEDLRGTNLTNLNEAIDEEDADPSAPLIERGDVIRFTNGSVMVYCDPVDDLDHWRHHLDADIEAVVPFPSFLAPVSERFKARRCLFIQPVPQAMALTRRYMEKQYPEQIDA